VPSPAQLLALFARVKQAPVGPYVETVSAEALVPGPLAPVPITAERRDSTLGTVEWTLGNGVHVVLKPTDFQADELLFRAMSPGGTSLVAADSLLISAQLSAQLVSVSGLGQFSATDLQKKLAGKAVRLSPSVGLYEQGLSGQASPRDAEALFQLAYLHFTAPRLDTAAVGAWLGNVRAALANRSASPQVAFSDTLSVTLTQHHRWTRPISAAVVDEVRPAAALDFFRQRFADAAGFTFFLVGSFDLDSIRPLVQRYLGNLPVRGAPDRAGDPGIRPPEGVVERTVRKGIEPKSQTALVFTGPARASREERFALDALAQILEIRLREELREELGGTYSVSVNGGISRIPREQYSLSISFGSAPERADSLVAAVWTEIDSIARLGPKPEELAKVKEASIRSRETNLRENRWWLSLLTGARREGEDPATRFALEPQLARLTPEVIRAAAETYLDRKRYVRVTLLPEK
jgi:zinc protease